MPELQMGLIEARFADLIGERAGDDVGAREVGGGGAALEADDDAHGHPPPVRKGGCLKRRRNGPCADEPRGVLRKQSKKFVEDTFSGSLPAFLAAFTSGRGLTAEEGRGAARDDRSGGGTGM